MSAVSARVRSDRRLRRGGRKREATWSLRIGIALGAFVALVALLGPLFAPHHADEIVGIPLDGSSGLLGTDYLGRDVLSRMLDGGRTVVGFCLAATAVAYVIGLTLGMLAGYLQGRTDTVIMRGVDVMISVPPLLFLLVVLTGTSVRVPAMILTTGLVLAPGLARIVRAAVLTVRHRGYVEAAVVRGESTAGILRREILPNIAGVLYADIGLRITYAVLLIASVNFLGLGLSPPAADWGLMISENRGAITLQPATVLGPALLLAMLTISANLIADGLARRQGISTAALAKEASGV